MTEPLYIAKGTAEGGPSIYLYPRMANRHGLVAGATGTGKTVTLQTMAENFSRAGVPVFVSDIKGDVSGISQPAGENLKVQARVQQLVLTDWVAAGNPVVFWDVFGEAGHPVRTTVSDMDATMLLWLLAELFENLPEAGDLDKPKLVFFIEQIITQLGVGEALVSFLDEKGTPDITERALILPPRSQIGMITPEQRAAIIKSLVIAGVYEAGVDRESAYEMLKAKAASNATAAEQTRLAKDAEAAAKKAEAEQKKAEAEQKKYA